MKHTLRVMRPLTLLACLLLAACGSIRRAGEKERADARSRELKNLNVAATSEADSRLGEKAAGEIVFVDSGGGFVLVRARNGVVLAPEQELECRGKGGGRIKITPERKNVFFAADIVKGEPAVGDPVIPVKGSGGAAAKLVPIPNQPGLDGVNPANTINVDPNSIRPEDLPQTTLGDPGNRPMMLNEPTHGDDGRGSRSFEPPLPDKDPPLLPLPTLPQ